MGLFATASLLTVVAWCGGLALLALTAYCGYPRWKRLTPLGKCVFLSVVAHLALLALLTQVQWKTFTGPRNPRVRFVRGAPTVSADPGESEPTPAAASFIPLEAEPLAVAQAGDSPPDGPVEDSVPRPSPDLAAVIQPAPPPPTVESSTDDPPAAEPEKGNEPLGREEESIADPRETAELAPAFDTNSHSPPPLDVPAAYDPTSAAAEPAMVAVPSAVESSGQSDTGGPQENPSVAPPSLYGARTLDGRAAHVRSGGGDEDTEAAVEAALAWLASAQETDGSWNPRRFGAGQAVDDQQRQQAGRYADTGLTGLATLGYLAAGHTHLAGTHRAHVQRALEYLLSQQSSTGSLVGAAGYSDAMYCHGMATLAVSEAYAMTHDARLQRPLGLALAFTLHMQDPGTGGWRYASGQPGDMSQHGWQMMGLASARQAGFQIPAANLERAQRFIDSVTLGAQGGLACYQPYRPPTRAMTAEALFCRLMSNPPTPRAIEEATQFLLQDLPGTSRQPNLYYWYYATLALYQVQGPAWDTWNEAMKRELLARQSHSGDLAGSWDPDDVYGRHGGRIYSTALATLCLEVYYRYLPLSVQLAQWNSRARR
jgi:hypothetical protein